MSQIKVRKIIDLKSEQEGFLAPVISSDDWQFVMDVTFDVVKLVNSNIHHQSWWFEQFSFSLNYMACYN